MGRTSKPTHLKLLAGNPGKRPINTEEPIPKGNLKGKEPPKEFGLYAKKMWKTCLDNSPDELLKEIDQMELIRYCVAYELYTQAYKEVKKGGAVVVNAIGNSIKSPWVSILNEQSAIMGSCGANLGFSPTSRTKIKIQADTKKKNKFALLEGMKQDD